MPEHVILVDPQDRELGVMEKLQAHQEGKLHRALSVLVFNSKGEVLLQQRAHGKYHFGGLWSNTCCSHPRPQEATRKAAMRRLKEEMGFTTDLYHAFTFRYQAQDSSALIEHEIDHVFLGCHDGTVQPNPEEVAQHCWIPLDALRKDIRLRPHAYTPWFQDIIRTLDNQS